ncbi:hypothetical protein [Caballeronia grimmiae]|uniref:Adhesin n=1 Tax=Caballeronia grimmiae TaxID=1071679 RepID=A0A069P037_9BURK|nr:hypothetical protein [Caballeronia grimmiae]KDR33294.1 adhesin [Caballeronia grimmiae]GGD90479.1 glycosyl transferase [Caballeronia grimmiae]
MDCSFTVERFESCAHGGKADEAIAMFSELCVPLRKYVNIDLRSIMDTSGVWPPPNEMWLQEQFARRMAAALVSLIGNTDFELTDAQFSKLTSCRPFIQHFLGAAPLNNADYVARKFLPSVENGDVRLPYPDAIKRLNLLCNSESRLVIDYSVCMRADPASTLNLAIANAGELLPGSAEAHRRREALLDWLGRTLEEVDDLRDIDVSALVYLYMNCTYTEVEHRHAIKRSVNKLTRASLAGAGLTDLDVNHGAERRANRVRPLMLVVLEAFTDGHSILRTHSRNLLAARARFDVVAICYPSAIEKAGREVFDRVIEIPDGKSFAEGLAMIREFAENECPDVLYMPSVGMSLLTISVSNMRLAPLQIAGLGHPATTHSDCIDYVSVEDDYVGDPACFSEALLRLPKDGQPYRPSLRLGTIPPRGSKAPGSVHIGIASSLMKLSPSFLAACKQILERSKVPVVFHFMTSGGDIASLMHLRRVASSIIPRNRVAITASLPYMDYIGYLNDMDMFLSPFPFGNTNGIVDAFTVGLPGVCKTGREVFERIDGAMFMRAYMPGWLVADTAEEYVDAAVRLANNREEREALRKYMLEKNIVQRFFEGRPEVFGEMVLDLVDKQKAEHASLRMA